MMRHFIVKSILFCGLASVLLSGCGQQSLTELKPKSQKQTVGIVYQGDQQTLSDIHQFVQDQLHTAKDTFIEYGVTAPSDLNQRLLQLAQQKQCQMIITNAPANVVQSLQQAAKNQTIAWIPDGYSDTTGNMPVPAVQVNQLNLAFLDGFLAGQLQNVQSVAIVLPDVQTTPAGIVQTVQAGLHYAGFNGNISIVDLSKLTASTSSTAKTKATNPSVELQKIPNRVLVFPVPVDENTIRATYTLGKQVILGYPEPFAQSNIVADAESDFAPKVQTLIEQWRADKWRPGQTITFFTDHMIRIRSAIVFHSPTIQSQLQALEQSIVNHSFDPQQIRQ